MKEITVKIQELDKPNKNNRIYSRKVMEEAVAKANARPSPMLGMIGMPDDGMVPIAKVSHFVKNLRIEDDQVIADIKILDTPEGAKLQSMLASDQVTFRHAGVGKVAADGTISDFEYISLSAVPASDAA